MTVEGFPLSDAATALTAAGLNVRVLAPSVDGWTDLAADAITGQIVGASVDSRDLVPDQLFVALPGSRRHGREFVGAALAAGAHALTDAVPAPVTAGGPEGRVLVVDDPLAAMTTLAGAWRARLAVRVIGVTGSNGKTTTKDLLAAAVSASGKTLATAGNLNSEQGVPLTLLALRRDHELAVIEMGASAVGHIAARAALARPSIGVITNAAAAHLEEFGSLEQIISGKGEMVADLPADGVAILNADSPGFADWCDRAPCPVVSWGVSQGDHRWSWRPGDRDAAGWLDLDGQTWPVPLPGRHNAANLTAAILAARAAGVADATIRLGLTSFRPSPHRAHLRHLAGRLVLDDAYNANPAGMLAAARMLDALSGERAYAVLGTMAELGDRSDRLHRECGTALAALGLAGLVTVGELAEPLAAAHEAAGGPTVRCADHAAAAAWLAANTSTGDRILVKGSRSATMERVIDALVDDHGWQEGRDDDD